MRKRDANRINGWLGILLLGLLLLPLRAVMAAADAVCARVKIEITQELTFDRQAFDAHMRINNGLDTLPLENISINVNFTDESGGTVEATYEQEDSDAKFFLELDSHDGLENGISGNGKVQPDTSADIHWLIIPTGASVDTPQGKLYFAGARLSYTVGGRQEVVDVSPDSIFVKPLPDITLDYFLTEYVYGDDPLTEDVIEAVQPFTLGVRLRNDGEGTLYNAAFASSQPRITENGNPQGLLIDFKILGVSADEKYIGTDLKVNFGNVPPKDSTMVRWEMTASLDGKFAEFDATIEHADELGGRLTSLVNEPETHFLIHDVLVDLPGRDGIRSPPAQPHHLRIRTPLPGVELSG